MVRVNRNRGGRALIACAFVTFLVSELSGLSAFIPPAGRNAHRTAVRAHENAVDAPAATVAAAAIGMMPLIMAPEASVAQGWETAVVAPLTLINTGLNLFKFCLGTYAIMSWLFAFGIMDMRNEFVQKIQGALSSVIDPVLGPLRSLIPPIAGFDISFMILWVVLEQAQAATVSIMFGALTFNADDTYMYYK
eukprot:TRINITY_DN81242_c0_g1_i1.p1 TRINITY_DN81242_c0_g1~~TRINITY_DN81242_c0_g1_i1.p1  ORF type:complete len:192 (+),score=39.42 TRINITY_DN81242_c0_g1_i1:75-650(+)